VVKAQRRPPVPRNPDAHPEGGARYTSRILHPFRVPMRRELPSGGLRCATTTGYYLAALSGCSSNHLGLILRFSSMFWNFRTLFCRRCTLFCRRRTLLRRRRTLLRRHRTLFCRHRTLFCRRRTLFCRHRALFCRHRTLFWRRRTLLRRHRTLFCRLRALFWRHRASLWRSGTKLGRPCGFPYVGGQVVQKIRGQFMSD